MIRFIGGARRKPGVARKELTPEALEEIVRANSRLDASQRRVEWIRGRWEETKSADAIGAWRAALVEQRAAWEAYWELQLEYFGPLGDR